ncbi:SDR family NAD(P)-dependent oxidoreductase [Paenibacillus donghaensis]|uniref:Short-chain dehydrogenase n=1 Tax=Paenibacillus donghaensis TaxID=414771 RepID=A0A2Z2KDJ4_9BACL|nr:SDR family NAD(P)-dependent oxidoreductase [Paenibacillus donghaensis]ASA24054.1 hypothetical protein B9T62_26700 [Paenibacillus donghaensis]
MDIVAYEKFGAYSAAKAGLEALMKTVTVEEAKHGILVNLFDPGNLCLRSFGSVTNLWIANYLFDST